VPGHTDEQLKEIAALYTKHNGSCLAAAKELGIPRSTFATRVESAKIRGFIRDEVQEVKETAELKTVYLKPHYKIYQRPKHQDVNCRILAIGDAHDGPELPDKSRFYAMGQYAQSNEITHIVQIGDFMSVDSMSTHDRNETIKGQNKPTYKEDLDSFEEALRYFNNGLDGYSVEKHVTLGNHEDRIGRFVNNNPEVAELLLRKYMRYSMNTTGHTRPLASFSLLEMLDLLTFLLTKWASRMVGCTQKIQSPETACTMSSMDTPTSESINHFPKWDMTTLPLSILVAHYQMDTSKITPDTASQAGVMESTT